MTRKEFSFKSVRKGTCTDEGPKVPNLFMLWALRISWPKKIQMPPKKNDLIVFFSFLEFFTWVLLKFKYLVAQVVSTK